MSTLGSRLRHAREVAGYSTAKDAAKAMAIPVSTYLSHENGSRGFPAKRATEYAREFKVSEQWLLYGKGDGPSSVAPVVTQSSSRADIRENIRRAIRDSKLSARSVSLKSGLSESMVHKWLTGRTHAMTIDNVESIADTLGKPIEELLVDKETADLLSILKRLSHSDRVLARRLLATFLVADQLI